MARYLREGLTEEGWAVRTHNRKLTVLRQWGRFMGWSDFLSGYKRPPNPPGVPHPLPEGMPGVFAMLEHARSPIHQAMVALCGLCGCRISEARQVRPSNLKVTTEYALLTILGKGYKTRTIPLSDRALVALIPRLAEAAATDAPLVPLSDRAARAAMNRIGQRALGRNNVATHDMRMTAGTAFYAASGNDLRAVQEVLGHSSSATTELYTEVNMKAMQKAVDV